MSSTPQIHRINGKFFASLCRFCGEQNFNMKIDNSWNEIFFDVNRKLFSFTAETLDGLKICISCVKKIDSICKFYNQVENISQILKKTKNSVTDDNSLISKYGFEHHEINISGRTYDGVLEIDSQVTAIENNSFQIEDTNTFDDNSDIAQEVINIEKDDIFEESRDYGSSGEAKSEDSISILRFQSSKAENVNEVNCPKPKIKTSLVARKQYKIANTKLVLPTKEKCPLCGEIYSSKKGLKRHICRLHSRIKLIACKICNQEFATRDSLKLHKINNKCLSGFKCEVCGNKFSTKPSLKEHKILHWTAEEKEANARKCPHCENKYLSKTKLQKHIRLLHNNEGPFVCEICNRVYGYKHSLRQHERNFHEKTIPKKMYKCEICGKTIASRTSLKCHKKLHLSTDERQTAFFKCPHCKLQYPSRGGLCHHIRVQHLNQKQLCEICGKEFRNKWNLKIHRGLHNINEKKNYECEICSKKCTTRFYLKVHKVIHSVESKNLPL